MTTVDVALVHWPAEAERLERLRAAREPRLVIVEHGPPPTTIDELEDWLRAPADETDMRIRLATLENARVAQRGRGVDRGRGAAGRIPASWCCRRSRRVWPRRCSSA